MLYHIITWLEYVADLNPTSFRAPFGPGTTFQGLEVQSFKIFLYSIQTERDNPMLSAIKLYLEVSANFGKSEGKRPVFKAYTVWMDSLGWFKKVLGHL